MIGGVFGVVHLPPMPGDPAGTLSFGQVGDAAMRDAAALVAGGVDGLVLENFGSAPFVKGTQGDRVPPHQVATLALLADRIKREHGVTTGVNCLRCDAISALGIAAAVGLDFVRVNVHVGAYVTDQGLIEGEAAVSMRYRRELNADGIAVWADVLVKHAQPLAPLSVELATHDVLERGLANVVIVTGDATGASVDGALVARVRQAAGEHPVWIGSGLTLENVHELAPLANGAIVGTHFKEDGRVQRPVDEARVRRLVDAARGLFRSSETR